MSVTRLPSNTNQAAIVSLVVLLVTTVGIGFYLARHSEVFTQIWVMPAWSELLLFVLSVLILTANGLYLKIFARKFNVDLQAKEWFGLSAVTTMGNYLTPFSGGLVARATYLKHRHDFAYSRFLVLLTANYLIVFAVISTLGLVVMISLFGSSGFSWPVLLLFAASLLAILLVQLIPFRIDREGSSFLRSVQSALEGLHAIRRDRVLLWKLVFLTVLSVLVGASLYFVVFHAIGASIPFRHALLIHLVTSFSVLFSITPGNLGIQEVVIGVTAAILGAGADTGLLASLIVRAAAILCAFSLGPIFSCMLSRELAGRDATYRAAVADRALDVKQNP